MKGLLFAGAIGYLVGTLLAPRKGSELRADLSKHFEKLQEEGSDLLKDGVREGQQIVLDVAEKGLELKESGAKKLTEATAAASRARDIATDSLDHLSSDVGSIVEKSKDILSNGHKE